MDPLLQKAKKGDKKAEEELFQFFLIRFRAIAKQRIWEGDAEDIAQEACKTVFQKYKTEKFTKGLVPWAYGVLRMKIGNYMQGPMRKQKRWVPASELSPGIKSPSEVPFLDLKRQLLHCLKQIIKRNPRYARVLNLKYHGFKPHEICRKLKVNRNSLYNILRQGYKLLRKCIKTGEI